ncbi:TolC family protein [Plebeiibacterium marinum]|uniref:TolC family protein n=1 Tax=Plebeiibacterium marinum TaxID=2992111 RepID=A0AAE3MBH2_9BACT|nr:TolC family protein [Plebeiobacterium marinum]MCW3804544.1 TolC family protein [Plebeiobacterium marinum]
MIKIQILAILFCILPVGMQAQNTLSLSQAIEMGLQNNYDLKITRNAEKISSINNTWGNTGALPTISFSTSLSEGFNYNDTENYRTEMISPELGLNWVLFDGFSARITKKKYEELENLSKGNTAILVENTIQEIVSAYNNCIVQQELVKVYAELMNLSEDRYNRELHAKDLGANTTYNTLLAKTSWLEDKSTYLQQKVEFENSIRTLNYALGIKDNKMWELTSGIKSDLPDYTLSDLTTKLLSNNTTLKNQYINQSLLAKETALAKSNYLPSLNINGGVSHTNRNVYYSKNSINDSKSNYSDVNIGLNLSYTIFNGGQRKRSVQIAKIEEESAVVETDQMKHSLQNQLLQIFSTYEVQKDLVLLANEREDAAKLNMDMAEEKLKTGAIDSFDFRDIQINYLNAAIQKLNAIYNVVESQTDLARITGGIINEF